VTVSWETLLEDARWAPSPHNGQQWRLRPLGVDYAELLCDPKGLIPAIDPTGAFTMVGLGAFAETLAVVARANGHDLVVSDIVAPPNPSDDRLTRVADLQLVAGGGDHLTIELVHRRRTSRLAYDGRTVSPALVERLDRACGPFGHSFHASSDSDVVAWSLELDGTYLLRDLRSKAAREELAEWLRYSNRSAARSGDGFSPAAMDVPGWMLYVLARAGGPLRLRPVGALVRWLHDRSVRGTATVGWLAGPFATPADWFAAGRALTRIWLEITEEGMYLQPLGSIIDDPSVQLRLNPEGDGTVWIVVRLGTGPEPARSHRRSVSALLAS
jgi:hypothetical protein